MSAYLAGVPPGYSLKICLMRLASSTACCGLIWAGVRLNSFSAAWSIGENFSAYGGLRKFGRLIYQRRAAQVGLTLGDAVPDPDEHAA